jgi:cation transport regulator ChaC
VEAVTRLAVFGYASLVSPQSAAQTLGRPVPAAIPARLEGWARGWTLGREQARAEKTFARPDGRLNLDPDAGAPPPNGVLIELTEAELDRLDVREIRYSRVDVTDAIRAEGSAFDRVIAYVARPEHHHPTPPDDAIVISTYPATIEAAFDRLGPGQLDLFRSTTAPVPVELSEAALIADRIPPGNPRDW